MDFQAEAGSPRKRKRKLHVEFKGESISAAPSGKAKQAKKQLDNVAVKRKVRAAADGKQEDAQNTRKKPRKSTAVLASNQQGGGLSSSEAGADSATTGTVKHAAKPPDDKPRQASRAGKQARKPAPVMPATTEHSAEKSRPGAASTAPSGTQTQKPGARAAVESEPERIRKSAGKEARKASKAAPQMPSVGMPAVGTATIRGKQWEADVRRRDLKHGPFSRAEKDGISRAVQEHAATHGLSGTDLSWLYATSNRTGAKAGPAWREQKGAWSAIAKALPHRSAKSVWACGTRMFHQHNYQGKWNAEEDARLKALVDEKGSRWKEIGDAVGRMPEACRDRWREIRLGAKKRSQRWLKEEVDCLRDAVTEYLEKRQAMQDASPAATLALEHLVPDSPTTSAAARGHHAPEAEQQQRSQSAKAGDGRWILDDIDWGAVSERVGTRTHLQCMEKWYACLSPSMVSKGEWGSGDDRRLLRALARGQTGEEFEVDWGALVPGRTAAQTRRRWRLMLKCVPNHRDRELQDTVAFLVESYAPGLAGLLGSSGSKQSRGNGMEEAGQ